MAADVKNSPINLGRMGPIQIIPPGFMGLLQLKQMGQLPGTLSSVVAPVIEMRDWYMTARRVGTLGVFQHVPGIVGGITTIGLRTFADLINGSAARVPDGQIWYVEQMTIAGTFSAAADTMRAACALLGQPTPNGDVLTLGPDNVDVVTAAVRGFALRNDRPFWAFPGDVFGIVVDQLTVAVQVNATLQIRVTPIPI